MARKLNSFTRRYTGAQQVILDENCNAYSVQNVAQTTLTVNGKQLLGGDPAAVPPIPGESLTISLEKDEVFRPAYIVIGNPNPAVDIRFEVTQLFYIDNDATK